ncbi:hypothetical protein [Haloarchaeobius amylolyticus]|uniref:hypothetical protein n=1 Tax=Haloarchaeobius amylolyticus TaxID=1198296 RepID=UPI00226E35EB|nr:hypothetical protein [Haloarchaeobius amylolyticus]
MDDADTDALLRALYEHLHATEELPIERTASRWIAEAEAVAGDLADSELADSVVRERVGHVEHLLAQVEGTGSEEADEHVRQAKDIVDRILAA